jgi:hypothetical protein
MSGTVGPTQKSRRQCLAALASEAQIRGLQCRSAGPDGALLHASSPSSGRSTMVFTVPSWSHTWTYLWGDGGSADAVDPAKAADLLAAFLDG